MKKLSEFINESNKYTVTLYKDSCTEFENELETHFYLEFANYTDNSNLSVMYESNGVYDGQKELAYILARNLLQNITKLRNTVGETIVTLTSKEIYNVDPDIKNVAYENHKTIVKFSKYKPISAAYIGVDKNTCVFEFEVPHTVTFKDLSSIYIHELQHVYNEYIKQISLLDYVFKDTKFSINDDIDTHDMKHFYHSVMYSLQKFERNAFVSELSVVLYKEYPDIKNYKDAIRHFEQTDVFKRYFGYCIALNTLPEDKQELFAKIYNEAQHTNKTFRSIKDKLNKQYKEIQRKIDRIVPRLYKDYAEQYIKEHKSPMTRAFIMGDLESIEKEPRIQTCNN